MINIKTSRSINTLHLKNFQAGIVKIIQLEEVNVVNKRELEKIENDYILKEINNPLCLNTNYAVFNDEKRKDFEKME